MSIFSKSLSLATIFEIKYYYEDRKCIIERFNAIIYNKQKFHIEMRIEKENQFSSFTKLLTRIDAGNLGEYELKVLKQEHDYLDRLRHQRVKIEELKQKYDYTESQLNEQIEQNAELKGLLEQKCQIIESLESELKAQIGKRQNLEKLLQKQAELDKGKSKLRLKELEQENQELKKIVRQKQLLIISIEEEFNDRIKKYKDAFQSEKKALIMDLQSKLNEAKSKNTDNEVLKLRNLVSRQNKALKLQNEKVEELSQKNQSLAADLEELKVQLERNETQTRAYEEKVRELYEQLEIMNSRLQKQDHNNKLKGQLEEIRRKMAEMQKGEIQKIEFIVNQLQ